MSSDISPVTPAQLVPQTQVVPFAQMLQQKQAQSAIAAAPSGDAEDAIDQCKEFKGLMPEWMLQAGVAYNGELKLNSDNGKIGKFLQAAVKLASIEAAFAQTVQQLQSFGALKSWLDACGPHSPCSENDALGTFASTLRNQIDTFTTDGDDTHVDSERQSEFSILAQSAAGFQNQAESVQTTTKELQHQGGNILGDEGTVGDFLEQMSEGFSKGM